MFVGHDLKQTNFDFVAEDANEQTLQASRPQAKIRITDKPIPLDHVAVSSGADEHVDERQSRYRKLKESRDRIFAQRHDVRPIPVVPSPSKRNRTENEARDSDIDFEPVSTKLFPVSKAREERIHMLKRMIYKAEHDAKAREAQRSQKITPAMNAQSRVKIEPLEQVLPPPAGPILGPSGSANHKDEAAAPNPQKNTPKTPEIVPHITPASRAELDAAIAAFEKRELEDLERQNMDQTKSHETGSDAGVKDSFAVQDSLFDEIDTRLAILEFKIDALHREIQLLESESRFSTSSRLYKILLLVPLCILVAFSAQQFSPRPYDPLYH